MSVQVTRAGNPARPKSDGYIDEIAIARTFEGDAAVGARLTLEEKDEVLRRAAALLDEEDEVRRRQRTPSLLSYNTNVLIGPEDFDDNWKHLLSRGLGFGPPKHERHKHNSLLRAVDRYRKRRATAA